MKVMENAFIMLLGAKMIVQCSVSAARCGHSLYAGNLLENLTMPPSYLEIEFSIEWNH